MENQINLIRAILYCRVSSKEQEETGYSLPAQEKYLQEYADRKGFSIVKLFSVSESASGKKLRAVFEEMIEFTKKGDIQVIICEKVDRLTRSFKDAVQMDEWLEQDANRQVHLVKNSLVMHSNSRSQDKLNWGIQVLFAKNYIDNLSEEVKKGQIEKISQGWLPTKPPLGYKTVGEKGHKIHVIDDAKAPLVKEIFNLYATGNYSIKTITKFMNDKGLTNWKNKPIVRSRMHQYLTDPFYYGKIRWNGEIYQGSHEPLISEEIFNKVQSILRGKTTPRIKKHNFIFQSLIRCGVCGCSVTWEIHKGHIYGRCNHYKPCVQRLYSKEDNIEKALMNGFESLKITNPSLQEWVRKALKEHHHDDSTNRNLSLVNLNGQIALIDKRLSGLYDDKLDGKIALEFYNIKLAEYTNDRNKLQLLVKKIVNEKLKYYQMGINFYEIALHGKLIYSKASPEEKRELIRMVFEKLIILDTKLSYTYSRPYKILYETVQASNRSEAELKRVKIKFTSELMNKPTETIQNPVVFAVRSALLPRVDSNHQHFD